MKFWGKWIELQTIVINVLTQNYKGNIALTEEAIESAMEILHKLVKNCLFNFNNNWSIHEQG